MNEELVTAVEGDQELAESLLQLIGRRVPKPPPGMESGRAGPGGDLVAAAVSDRGLEAIVERHGRPSLFIFDGMYEPPLLTPWADRLEAALETIRVAIAATGRVEVKGIGASHLGTAWMIEDNVAVTNRHVAELFTRMRNGVFEVRHDVNGQPFKVVVDFLGEADNTASREVAVTGVLYVASAAFDEPDVAFLELDPATAPSAPALGDDKELTPQEFLAAIGYPAFDTRNNAADQKRIFGGTYDVKRLAPGWVKQLQPTIFTHDCTTLGGNSGSLIVSLKQGGAVGLHFSGVEGVENRAVRIGEVRRLLDRARGREVVPMTLVGAVSPVGGPASGEIEAPPPALDGRAGYQATGFLADAVTVPLPTTIDPAAEVLTPLTGPGPDGAPTFELRYHHYSSFMHAGRKLPMFTAVNIDGTTIMRPKRTRDRWFLDPRMAADAQTGAELYQGNALDQGHLVRRLDPAWGDLAEPAIADTFFYTNCAPQHAGLNRTTWLSLEDYVLESAQTHGFRVCVFCGPVFSDKDPVYRETTLLPQAFWKVVVTLKDDEAAGAPALASSAYVLSQADLVSNLEFAFGPFRTYQVPIGRVSRWARLRFDPAIVAADAMNTDTEGVNYRAVEGPADMLV